MTLILLILAAVALHRLWNYEDIFLPVRQRLRSRAFKDPMWNLLWLTPLAMLLLWAHPAFLIMIACYPILRGSVALHDHFYPPPKEGCLTCAQKRAQMGALNDRLRSFERRVVLLGFDWDDARVLAHENPKWAFITVCNKSGALSSNLIHIPQRQRDESVQQQIINHMMLGGNASVVLKNCTDAWEPLIRKFGNVYAFAWIHVTDTPITFPLPPHHRVVAPGSPVPTVVASTPSLQKPPTDAVLR
jgi:hypothetical protein